MFENVSSLALFMGSPGLPELLIIGCIALLLFGKRLPEVARSLGKGIVEFKKGVQGIEDDVNHSTYADSGSSRPAADDRAEFTAPRFDPSDNPPS